MTTEARLTTIKQRDRALRRVHRATAIAVLGATVGGAVLTVELAAPTTQTHSAISSGTSSTGTASTESDDSSGSDDSGASNSTTSNSTVAPTTTTTQGSATTSGGS